MSSQILESVERDLVQKLLRTASIYEAYRRFHGPWDNFYDSVIDATGGLVDANGNPIVYTGREVVRMTISLLVAPSEPLLSLIRRLERSDVFDEASLYEQLEQLSIPPIDEAEVKGLFLLAGKFGEDNQLFVTGA